MRRNILKISICLVVALTLPVVAARAVPSINAGDRTAIASNPFKSTPIAEFDLPWAISFLPDGRLILTEKRGRIFLVTPQGNKTEVGNVPDVSHSGQNGLLDIAPAPDFAGQKTLYFTYTAPARGGSSLVLARAVLHEAAGKARLDDVQIVWQQSVVARGGQPGGIIAFAPDGKHLFLSVGDRMQPDTAQDKKAPMGKILRFNLDGSVPADNPHSSAGGIEALTWSSGHRNPYGLAFAADGKLWEHEMGPRGGDEFNLIEPGKNYGWPLVSNGDNYSGTAIPRHQTRPKFAPPAVYWTPVIAPAGLAFYNADLFAGWRGSALIGGLSSMALVRVQLNPQGGADEAERFDMDNRIRDVAVAADGAIWLIEDDNPGRLLRLTPK